MSRTRIDRLTKAEEAQLIPWRDKWIEIGLKTGEADWEQFERAVKECYKFAELRWPVPIVRVQSPIVGALAAPFAVSLLSKNSVRSAVDSAVRSAVSSAVGNAVDSAVYSAVSSAGKIFWHPWIGGQFWISWQAWEGFFRHVCDLKLSSTLNDRAQAYEDVQTSAAYWWPNKNFVMVCNRPMAIRRDRRGRFHSENSKSIEWPDGWGLYSLHGVTVPAKYIETPSDRLDPAEILREQNAQVRMALIGKIGFGRLLGRLKHKQISRGVSEGNSLIEFDLGNGDLIRALHLRWITKDGIQQTVLPVPRTKEQFGSDAPDNIENFEQVRRWTMGVGMDAEIVAES